MAKQTRVLRLNLTTPTTQRTKLETCIKASPCRKQPLTAWPIRLPALVHGIDYVVIAHLIGLYIHQLVKASQRHGVLFMCNSSSFPPYDLIHILCPVKPTILFLLSLQDSKANHETLFLQPEIITLLKILSASLALLPPQNS